MIETPAEILEHAASKDAVRGFIAWRKAQRSDITLAVLRRLIEYDADTGSLAWRPRPLTMFSSERIYKTWNTRYAGSPALDSMDQSNGYLKGAVLYVPMYAHRVAFAIHHGRFPHILIDHINNNRTDNRAANLRDVGHAENARNVSPLKGKRAVGVYFIKSTSKWEAKIKVGNDRHTAGHFEKFEDALKARKDLEGRFWR